MCILVSSSLNIPLLRSPESMVLGTSMDGVTVCSVLIPFSCLLRCLSHFPPADTYESRANAADVSCFALQIQLVCVKTVIGMMLGRVWGT